MLTAPVGKQLCGTGVSAVWHSLGALLPLLAVPLPIQLPSNAPGKAAKSLGHCTQQVELEDAPTSGCNTPATAVIWGLNWHIEDPLCLSPLSCKLPFK